MNTIKMMVCLLLAAGVVACGEKNRHYQQQRSDSEGDLQYGRMEEGVYAAPNSVRQVRFSQPGPVGNDQNEGRYGKHAMFELNGRHVVEEVPPGRLDGEEIGRYPVLAHFRKGVVDLAGLEPGYECPGHYGHGYQRS